MAEGAVTWGSGGEKLTPSERRRKIAEAMILRGTSTAPVQHWTQGAARVAEALMGQWDSNKIDAEEKAGQAAIGKSVASLLPGSAAASPMPASAATVDPSVAVAATPAALAPVFTSKEAEYKLPTNYLPQVAKIESSFNPSAANPNSSARGLFQFTKGTARDYGLSNPMDPIASTDAAARLAADNAKTLTGVLGRAPTAGELYLAHQQGGGGASKLLANPDARAIDIVGRDAVLNNGGRADMSAGEFAKRWTNKVAANEADMPASNAAVVEAATGQPGFAIPAGEPAAPAMTPQNFAAISQPLDPVFKTEGASQPWMGTALAQPQAAPAMVAQAPATLPPPRPADLALANPQADMPAPGAVQAMGQAPQMMPDLSNTPDGGMRQIQLAEEQARQSQQAAPQVGASPISRVAQALGIQSQPVAAAVAPASPAVAQVAAAIGAQPAATSAPATSPAIDRVATAMGVLNSPYAQPGQKAIAQSVLAQAFKDPTEVEGKKLAVDLQRKALAKSDDPTAIQEYNLAKTQGETRSFTDWKLAQTKAGATSVNVNGGGSDKQIFDTFAENTKEARAAANGLVALREARGALAGGAFTGAGADTKLALQKAGAAFGLGDVSKIENTETFRSAIAPQVAAMLKSTVGSANISNSDREFAEKAAGGSIQLDERSINRLMDIMEKASVSRLELHQKQLEAVYPDPEGNRRERALFGVATPPAPAASPNTPVRVKTPDEARKLPSGTRIILPDGSEGRVP